MLSSALGHMSRAPNGALAPASQRVTAYSVAYVAAPATAMARIGAVREPRQPASATAAEPPTSRRRSGPAKANSVISGARVAVKSARQLGRQRRLPHQASTAMACSAK